MEESKSPKIRVKLFITRALSTEGSVTVSNRELAQTLGTVPRTVTRALAELREEGAIHESWDSTGCVRTFSVASAA
tara:strand:- start:386 stop:613 length:228 start_codon:yes stop_codon:yes gene_type:complete